MMWFLVAVVLSGPPSGPLGPGALMGNWPVAFNTQNECLKASTDPDVVDKFYHTSKEKYDLGFFCVAGRVRKAGP